MPLNGNPMVSDNGSFWEVDSYKRTVKRLEHGYKLANELAIMIKERADIEGQYARSLKAWAKRWSKLLENGSEYGTIITAHKGVLTEAEDISIIHREVKERISKISQINVRNWIRANYTKPVIGQCKETKELEESFRKAQKPWGKLAAKAEKSRKEYHSACKQEKSAILQESNAKSDSAISLENLTKLQEKKDKSHSETVTTKTQYEDALSALNDYNPKYMEQMSEVFNHSQQLEHQRLLFVKDILFQLHECLDLYKLPNLLSIHFNLYKSLKEINPVKDLKWWSENHGVDMVMKWPTFDEYKPELNAISNSEKPDIVQSNVHLTNVHQCNTDAWETFDTPANSPTTTNEMSSLWPTTEWKGFSSGGNSDGDKLNKPTCTVVHALYDYEAKEQDELSLAAGDILTQIGTSDEQGWCLGRKEGRLGLYPASYVELI